MLRGISKPFCLGDGSTLLSPVVRKVDNAIQQINLYPVANAIGCLKRIRWIVIYPVDSVIRFNNRGLGNILETEFLMSKLFVVRFPVERPKKNSWYEMESAHSPSCFPG